MQHRHMPLTMPGCKPLRAHACRARTDHGLTHVHQRSAPFEEIDKRRMLLTKVADLVTLMGPVNFAGLIRINGSQQAFCEKG